MKKIVALLLALLTIALSLVACSNKNGDDSSDTSGSQEPTKKYDYVMSNYVTLPTYNGYEVKVELDTVQATIDKYLAQYSQEYTVTKGDDVYVDIVYHEVVRSIDQNGAPIDQRGEEITELKKENYLIEDIGAGSYFATVENSLIGKYVKTADGSINIQNTASHRLTLPNDFYAEEWQGKEVFIDMTFVSKECKLGDVVLADYTGYLVDQETLQRLTDEYGKYKTFDSSTGVQFFLGSHLAIEDFEKGIEGAKINEAVTFNATFPSDYFNTELQGKIVEFEVVVTKIYTPPIYNDDFTKECLNVDSTKELENTLKEKYAFSQIQSNIDKAIIISYPQAELNQEMKKLSDIEDDWVAEYGISLDSYIQSTYGMTREEYVKSNMKQEMIYYAVAQAENIVPSETQLQDEKQSLYDYYYDYYVSKNYAPDEAQKSANAVVEDLGEEYIYEQVLFNLVEQRLLEVASITYVEKTYTSVTEPQN